MIFMMIYGDSKGIFSDCTDIALGVIRTSTEAYIFVHYTSTAYMSLIVSLPYIVMIYIYIYIYIYYHDIGGNVKIINLYFHPLLLNNK